MQQLTTTKETMSSLQIAELTGKNHAHVMRDIRNMVEKINESSRGLVKGESKESRVNAKAEGYVKDVPFEYTHSDGTTGVNSNMQWTQKGRMFLYEFQKAHDVLPLIEITFPS